MPNGEKARIKALAAELQSAFEVAGAVPREPESLQPAEVLLDLYGEDIRARAYVTSDPVRGEQMLRPDFTVPIVQMHMAHGAEPARYTYNGSVWRKQMAGSQRSSENTQVGFELFDRSNPAAADAEVFALFNKLLDPWRDRADIRVATGDVGILQAAVRGLQTTDRRKSALLRHLWRPTRFRQLLTRFCGQSDLPIGRAELVAAAKSTGAESLVANSGPLVGLRSATEIAMRIDDLAQDIETAPISAEEFGILDQILSLKSDAGAALSTLQDVAVQMPVLSEAVARLEARLEQLSHRGIAVETLPFEGNFGLTAMEYYDGFVFGFFTEDADTRHSLASGGRYDALTKVLGQGRSIPAVGGVFHPETLVALEAEA